MSTDVNTYFGLSPEHVLQVILSNPRCLMNVKGAVAEEHLRLYIERLKERQVIEGYTVGGEGQPDFALYHHGRRILVECKNVQKAKNRANQSALVVVTIDFKKTRNQLGGPQGRFYRRSEFDVVAACLFNRTDEWRFVFAPTGSFDEHPTYPGQGLLHDKLVVMRESQILPNWTDDLESLLAVL